MIDIVTPDRFFLSTDTDCGLAVTGVHVVVTQIMRNARFRAMIHFLDDRPTVSRASGSRGHLDPPRDDCVNAKRIQPNDNGNRTVDTKSFASKGYSRGNNFDFLSKQGNIVVK